MSRIDNEFRITLSVLDRLLDYEPEMAREAASSRARNLRQLKQAVRRDLEWLLNTRRHADHISPDMKELNASVAFFGLPDFTTASVKSPADQTRMRRSLEQTIRLFEPRLQDVSVTLQPMKDTERVMRFRIDARLKVDPAPEPVTFDTVLQLGSGQYLVQGE